MRHRRNETGPSHQRGLPDMGIRHTVEIHHFGNGAHVIALLVIDGNVLRIDVKNAPVFRKITVGLDIKGVRHQSSVNGRKEAGRTHQSGMVNIM